LKGVPWLAASIAKRKTENNLFSPDGRGPLPLLGAMEPMEPWEVFHKLIRKKNNRAYSRDGG
jgi:hypothetical protein